MQKFSLLFQYAPYLYCIVFMVLFTVLLIKDCKKSEIKNGGVKGLSRMLSGIGAIILMVAAAVLGKWKLNSGDMIGILILAVSVIISCPATEDNSIKPLFAESAVYLFSIFLLLLAYGILPNIGIDAGSYVGIGLSFVAGLLIMVSISFNARQKFQKVRRLFRNDEVWRNVMDYSTMFYSIAILCVSGVFCVLQGCPAKWCRYVETVLGLALCLVYALMYERLLMEKSFLLGRKKENYIKAIIRGKLKDTIVDDDSSEMKHMSTMYKRVLNYMEQKKPFLDDNFSLVELSKAMFTNKVYLSRTINAFSGHNFSQFVNYHRINYSMDLFKNDPALKVTEVAMMSGFHTVVSYNMAFKLFNNETPSEWIQKYRISLIEK